VAPWLLRFEEVWATKWTAKKLINQRVHDRQRSKKRERELDMEAAGSNRRRRISFHHWPPTSFEEAVAQYEMCFQKGNRHRRHLAYSWLSNLAISKRRERYRDGEREIRR